MTPVVPMTTATNPGQEAAQEPAQGQQQQEGQQGTVDAAREAVEQAREAVDREAEGASASTGQETGDVAALRREAAQRRRQLRTVEQERDQLRERVDRLDRAEVERRAAVRFTKAPARVAGRLRGHPCRVGSSLPARGPHRAGRAGS